MAAEPSSSSLTRDEPAVAAIKPYFKLRLGGSRSVVTGKFLKDTLYTPGRRHDLSVASLEPTRSRDSHSISSRSTDSSSLNQEKVRIVGRGGAGARRRNYSKIVPVPAIEMKPLPAPEDIQDEPILRNVGRGGLGSRPQGIRSKGKAVDSPYKRKKSKQFRRSLSLDRELRPKSPESQVSTISTIHFTGETGSPPPDFFKVTKKRSQRLLHDPDELDEERDLNRTFTGTLHPSRMAPSAVPWDDTPTTSQSNLASRAKAKRRERGLSLLFSMFQHDVTRKPGSGPSPPSMSIPSQITLTSIETDPSYFFHGPGSRPSTPPCGQETDSTTGSSCSARLGSSLSSFQREPTPPSILSSKKEEIDDEEEEKEEEEEEEELHEPSSLQPDHGKHPSPPTKPRPAVSSIPQTLRMHLSAIEAEALGSPPCSPFLQESIPFVPSYPPMTAPEAGDSISKSEEPESWTGEWNVGIVDVIKALRELR